MKKNSNKNNYVCLPYAVAVFATQGQKMLHPRNGKISNAMGQKDEENEKQKSRKENRAFFYSTR